MLHYVLKLVAMWFWAGRVQRAYQSFFTKIGCLLCLAMTLMKAVKVNPTVKLWTIKDAKKKR